MPLLFALLFTAWGNARAQTTFFDLGAEWKYLDDGSDQGMAWREIDFDDSAWAIGPGKLGYGEADQGTALSFGGSPSRRHITYYFRRTFEVLNPGVTPGLKVDIVRDDGAIVYVNGTEIGRSNMPEGAVDFTTRALSSVAGDAERLPQPFIAGPETLVAGTNTIAVEVHQASPGSSDMAFDMRLSDVVGPTAPIIRNCQLTIRSSDGSVPITSENISAVDFSSDEAGLIFTVSGVQSGQFERVSNPGVRVTTFAQSQVASGEIRFVYESTPFGAGASAGNLGDPFGRNELSGVVSSTKNPGVLWAIEDSDNAAALLAIGVDGADLGDWLCSGISNIDWEDIAAARIGGVDYLYVGGFGDNDAVRSSHTIYRIREPEIVGNGGTIPAVDIEAITLQYPESPAGESGVGGPGVPARRDAEALIVDPLTGDVYVLSKREVVSRIFRLAYEESYTGMQTMEYVGDMQGIVRDTVEGYLTTVTGADISRDGMEVVVRNYEHLYHYRRLDEQTSLADLLTGNQMQELPFVGVGPYPDGDPKGEAICFSATGDALFTVGENLSGSSVVSLFRYPSLPDPSPPAFSITVSDGVLTDGPHPATVHFNQQPIEEWRLRYFPEADLNDPEKEASVWGHLADPDFDGLQNMIELALGSSPIVASPAAYPRSRSETIDGVSTLAMEWNQLAGETSVTVQAEQATDLSGWLPIESELVSESDGVQSRRVSIPIETGGTHLRLRVTVTP